MRPIHQLLLILSLILMQFTVIAQGSVFIYLVTESGDTITDANINLIDPNGNVEILSPVIKENNGYRISNFPSFSDTYTISIEKDINPLEGVTTFDLVLMINHILGLKILDSPYKIIAADINNDEAVTSFDIVQLRRLILFINTDFQNTQSWRFIDEDYEFPDPLNPWLEPIPENSINFPITENKILTYVAIKMGNVH